MHRSNSSEFFAIPYPGIIQELAYRWIDLSPIAREFSFNREGNNLIFVHCNAYPILALPFFEE